MPSLELINTGVMANDETGDPLQVAFRKINLAIAAVSVTSPPGGANGAVQYNNAGVLAGGSLVYDAQGNVQLGTTTGHLGNIGNDQEISAGLFSTARGIFGLVPNASTITAVTLPVVAGFTYLFSAGTVPGDPTTDNAVSIVTTGGANAALTPLKTATRFVISLLGLDVQVTQTTGSANNVLWSIIRIA
jgi:hypothetical protein